MTEKLSMIELQALYNELMPMFKSVLHQSAVTSNIAEVVADEQRESSQQIRKQQDEEERRKIRSAIW